MSLCKGPSALGPVFLLQPPFPSGRWFSGGEEGGLPRPLGVLPPSQVPPGGGPLTFLTAPQFLTPLAPCLLPLSRLCWVLRMAVAVAAPPSSSPSWALWHPLPHVAWEISRPLWLPRFSFVSAVPLGEDGHRDPGDPLHHGC